MISYSVKTTKEIGACDMLVVPVFEGKSFDAFAKQIDGSLKGQLSEIIKINDFEGKRRQQALVYTANKQMPRVLLLGLGKQSKLTIKIWKQVLGTGIISAQNKKAKSVAFIVPTDITKKFGAKTAGTETVNGIEIAHYSYDDYKGEKERTPLVEKCEFFGVPAKMKAQFEQGIEEGHVIADSVQLVRTLGNVPPSDLWPERLAAEAQRAFTQEKEVEVRVLGFDEIRELGMGCFLGVASGSQHEPKFVIIEYWGAGGGKKSKKQAVESDVYEPPADRKPTVLVGKGITYDSGGLSIKPMEFLTGMKFDMLGAASVIGIIKAVAGLGIKKNIVGLIPICENMPGGRAYRPDDVLRAMDGKTVEVRNTDAEGRLILADALCYAKKYNPKEVIDLATLTGACLVALGNDKIGLFSPHEKMTQKLIACSKSVGEELWELPLGEEFSETLKSDIADIANIGFSRYAGASVGAAFLQFFVDFPWAHIDMAAAFNRESPKPWIRPGATGVCVQTMIKYLRG